MMENIKGQLRQMEELQEVRLRNELMSLKNSLSIMRNNILMNKGVLQRVDALEILNHTSNLDKKLNPTNKRIQFPFFVEKNITEKVKIEIFGTIKQPVLPSQSESGSRHLLKDTRVVSSINGKNFCFYRGIACINSEEAWIGRDDNLVSKKNIQGEETGSVKLHEYPQAISSNMDGELFFTCWKTRSVMKYNETGFHKIVCMKSDSNQSRVVRFKGNKVTQTIQYNGNNPLFEDATFVTENRNGDDCVCNSRGKTRDSIVVVSTDGLLKSVYESESTSVTLRGIATDTACCILFIYEGDKRIHMLDRNGKYLTSINTDDDLLNGISVDKENKIWLSSYRAEIKVFNYLGDVV